MGNDNIFIIKTQHLIFSLLCIVWIQKKKEFLNTLTNIILFKILVNLVRSLPCILVKLLRLRD